MGRYQTGVITSRGAMKLGLKNLIQRVISGSLPYPYTGTIKWDSGAKIGFSITNDADNLTLKLYYTHTDHNGVKTDMSYFVELVTIPSNLGIGKIYYFKCPVSNKLCRTLYLAYGSQYFKHRAAYNTRIYYMGQIRSKNDRFNYRYWDLDELLEYIHAKGYKTQYKGKPTKIAIRVQRLTWHKNEYNLKRFVLLGARWGISLP